MIRLVKKAYVVVTGILFCWHGSFAQQADSTGLFLKKSPGKFQPKMTKVYFDEVKKCYKVTFKEKGKEMIITYDMQGHVNQTEENVPTKQLPVNAKKYLSNNYGSLSILKAMKVTSFDGKICYRVEIKDQMITLDNKGNFTGAVNITSITP